MRWRGTDLRELVREPGYQEGFNFLLIGWLFSFLTFTTWGWKTALAQAAFMTCLAVVLGAVARVSRRLMFAVLICLIIVSISWMISIVT